MNTISNNNPIILVELQVDLLELKIDLGRTNTFQYQEAISCLSIQAFLSLLFPSSALHFLSLHHDPHLGIQRSPKEIRSQPMLLTARPGRKVANKAFAR
jgi:hypothetical protein